MREIRLYGSEGGEVKKNTFPTPIKEMSARHAESGEVEIEKSVAFLALVAFHFAQTHDLAHDLGVKALALGFSIDFLKVRAQRGLFLFEALYPFDQRFQLVFGEVGFGHCRNPIARLEHATSRARNLVARRAAIN